jgi:hypothetical protein
MLHAAVILILPASLLVLLHQLAAEDMLHGSYNLLHAGGTLVTIITNMEEQITSGQFT